MVTRIIKTLLMLLVLLTIGGAFGFVFISAVKKYKLTGPYDKSKKALHKGFTDYTPMKLAKTSELKNTKDYVQWNVLKLSNATEAFRKKHSQSSNLNNFFKNTTNSVAISTTNSNHKETFEEFLTSSQHWQKHKKYKQKIYPLSNNFVVTYVQSTKPWNSLSK